MTKDRLPVISAQLDRTLSFFSRVESKSSLLFASNIGILSIMLYNVSYQDIKNWYVVVPVILASVLVAFSLGHLYLASFPDTKGGNESLFYFKSVGSNTEQNYVDTFTKKTDLEIEKDLLGQIWRNSQILNDKFSHVENAYKFSLLSIIPWIFFLFASSFVNTRTPLLG
jgi:hypothetical protein